MPLTPEDVRAKKFSTVRLKEGYDEDEVDAFLDEIEAELARLFDENTQLRGQLSQSRVAAPAAAASAPTSAPVAAPAAPAPTATTEAAAANAARLLAAAQQTADHLEAQAKAEADRVLAEARAKASSATSDAEQRNREVMASLQRERDKLQGEVDTLKAFEREYRTRLKSYLETQLRELERATESSGNRSAASGPSSGASGPGQQPPQQTPGQQPPQQTPGQQPAQQTPGQQPAQQTPGQQPPANATRPPASAAPSIAMPEERSPVPPVPPSAPPRQA